MTSISSDDSDQTIPIDQPMMSLDCSAIQDEEDYSAALFCSAIRVEEDYFTNTEVVIVIVIEEEGVFVSPRGVKVPPVFTVDPLQKTAATVANIIKTDVVPQLCIAGDAGIAAGEVLANQGMARAEAMMEKVAELGQAGAEATMEKVAELSQAAGMIPVQTEEKFLGRIVDHDNESLVIVEPEEESALSESFPIHDDDLPRRWNTWSDQGLAIVRWGWTAYDQGSGVPSSPVPVHQI